jgi:hypothetical protein
MSVVPAVLESRSSAPSTWEVFWFSEIPPHIYALLRILCGLLALVSLAGVSDLATFWDPDGFVPASGLKTALIGTGLGLTTGRLLFLASLASYLMMTIGYGSQVTVVLASGSMALQVFWNYLPLSAAHAALQSVLFCLCWADCGSVWSLDSWLARRRKPQDTEGDHAHYPIAPLRLIRFQVALLYLNSGVFKLFDARWRDGSAVYYALSNNVYRRFPFDLPPGAEWITTTLTYTVLFWELAFAVMILVPSLRRVALLAGVAIHIGIAAGIEIGPFPWVMIASYVSFLNPERIAALPPLLHRTFSRLRRT